MRSGCRRSIAAVVCQVAVGLLAAGPAYAATLAADPALEESASREDKRIRGPRGARAASADTGDKASLPRHRTEGAGAYPATASDPVTVVSVDPQRPVRDAVKQSLSAPGLEVVGEARTGEEAVPLVVDVRPGVVVMELFLPRMTGVEMIKELSVLAPATRILVFTAQETRHAVVEAIGAGACGYLLKPDTDDEVVSAVRALAAGECFISTHIAGYLLERVRERDIEITGRSEEAATAIRAVLTERELEVFERLASGKSSKEIGRELSLSVHTVKHHIASILSKLQLDNRIQAAVQAVRSGIS